MEKHHRLLHLHTHTISFRLTALCLLISLLISVCSSTILILHISRLIRDENKSYLNNLLDNLISGIDTTIYNASQINRMLLNHVDIQDILVRSQRPDYTVQDFQHDRDQIAIIMNSLSVTEGIFYTSFHTKDGEYLFDGNVSPHPINNDLFSDPWILEHKDEIDKRNQFLITPIHSPNIFYGSFQSLMIIRPLKDLLSKEVIAYIAVYADSSEFQTLLKRNLQSITRDTKKRHNGPVLSIRLTDTDHIVIASTNAEEYGHPIEELASPDMLLSSQSSYSGFTVYIEPSPSYLSYSLRSTLIPILGIIAVILFLFGALTIALLQQMLYPLKKLTSNMQFVGLGNFKLRMDESTCHDDDIREIYIGFNHMTEKIDDLITNVYEQQLLLKSAQLQSLTYQINPHFLYNTLQTIEAIAEVRDIPEVQTIATSLASMFRYNLKPENFVPLSDELAHLETYFSIECIRFRNQIKFEIDLAPQLYPLSVPKFILQPIVENSLTHAFKGSQNPCKQVLITGEMVSNQKLFLYVSDNGVGMDPQQVNSLNQDLACAVSSQMVQTKNSIGLTNVHQRIVNCCGTEYGLSITARPKEGTCVTICLPYLSQTDT